MTTITFECPKCGATLNGREDRVGQWGTCPKCFKKILFRRPKPRDAQRLALNGVGAAASSVRGAASWRASEAVPAQQRPAPSRNRAAEEAELDIALEPPPLLTIRLLGAVLRVLGWGWLGFTPIVFVWVMMQQAGATEAYLRTTDGMFDGLFDALLTSALASVGPFVLGLILLVAAEGIRLMLAIESNTRAAGNAVIAAVQRGDQ